MFRHPCRNVALQTLFATSGYLSYCGLQPVHSFPFDPWLPGYLFLSYGTILCKNPRDGYDVVEIPVMLWKCPLDQLKRVAFVSFYSAEEANLTRRAVWSE